MLRFVWLSGSAAISDAGLAVLEPADVRQLHVAQLPLLSAQALLRWVFAARCLVSVDVSHCPALSAELVRALGAGCPKIETLRCAQRLHGRRAVDSDSLCFALERFERLRRLDVGGLHAADGAVLRTLTARHGAHLIELYCAACPRLGSADLAATLAACTALQRLDLSDCAKLPHECGVALLLGCPNLRSAALCLAGPWRGALGFVLKRALALETLAVNGTVVRAGPSLRYGAAARALGVFGDEVLTALLADNDTPAPTRRSALVHLAAQAYVLGVAGPCPDCGEPALVRTLAGSWVCDVQRCKGCGLVLAPGCAPERPLDTELLAHVFASAAGEASAAPRTSAEARPAAPAPR